VALAGCGDEAPAQCPHTAAWVDEFTVVTGEEFEDHCLPVALYRDSGGEVDCTVVEVIDPMTTAACAEIPGRVAAGSDDDLSRPRCMVEQVRTSGGAPPEEPPGWYYDDFSAGVLDRCEATPQRLSFTQNAEPRRGSVVKVECVYSLQGRGRTIDVGTPCAADPSICGNAPAGVVDRFPAGLACDAMDTVTCQPLCDSDSDCPVEYDCLDPDGDGTKYCVDARCVSVGSP